jgi:hypothetical protein
MYQHDFLENFDLGLFGPDAGMTSSSLLDHGEVFAQQQQLLPRQPQQLGLSLVERMQGDKQETLYSLSHDVKFNLEYETLEASSNLHEMMELGEVEEVKFEPVVVKDENDHQDLIDEVEKFLQQHEASVPVLDVCDEPIFEDCPMSSTFISEEDKLAAESLIDQLFCGSIAIDLEDQQFNDFVDDTSDAVPTPVVEDTVEADQESGFVDASQLSSSEMVMADGTKVIIVIAPESPEMSQIDVASPMSEFVASPESDESWSPEPATSSGRSRKRATERKGGIRKAKSSIVDKKERKKHQNVEAARRYRDKKKNEQQLIDEELDELTLKNTELKRKVGEKEAELKTLKKLMIELGLIKVA